MRKNILLSLLATGLAAALLVAAMLYQRYSDAARLAQMETLPIYTGAVQDPPPSVTDETTTPEREDAPDVQFYDAEGNAVKLSDFEGKPVVVNFWASWSGPSREEFPVFAAAYDTYKEQVTFLMINVTDGTRETEKSAMEYWQKRQTQLPVYLDKDSTAMSGFNVNTVPTTFFVDAQGKAVAYAAGGLSAQTLERGIQMCLSKNDQ